MTSRTILKERDSKPLIEQLRRLPSLNQLSSKSRVELEEVKQDQVVFVDGQPIAFRRSDQLIPVLVNTDTLPQMPRVVVDMGAVPHVVAGADVMAPGVRRIEGEFGSSTLVVVVDEKYGKSLAVGRTLLDSKALASTRKGKVVENLHYVGDQIWEVVKGFSRQNLASS